MNRTKTDRTIGGILASFSYPAALSLLIALSVARPALADLTPIYPDTPFVNRGGGLGSTENTAAVDPAFSPAGVTQATYKTNYTALGGVSTVQPVYANQAAGETAVPNPITVRASVLVNGVTIPVTFGGARDVTIQPGGYAIPDALPLSLTKGQNFAVLTNVSVASGGEWALGNPGTANFGDQYQFGADATDTNTGWQNGDLYEYAPVTVCGALTDKQALPLIGISGDSIISAQGDGQGSGGLPHEYGFAVRALDTLGLPWVRASFCAEAGAAWAGNNTNRLRWFAGCAAVIDDYGTNDIYGPQIYGPPYSVFNIEQSLIADWRSYKTAGVPRVFQTTIVPGGYSGAQEAARAGVNEWLRSGQAVIDSGGALTGVFDTAAAVEADSEGGAVSKGGAYWALDYKYNQVHPDSNGHAAMAAVIAQQLPSALAAVVVPEAGTLPLVAGVVGMVSLLTLRGSFARRHKRRRAV